MKKPNIIYILADDMGFGDISILNKDSQIHTHRLDEMAKNGAVFNDAHSTSAVCTPSRYGILTGRYNWRSWLKEFVVWGYDKPVIEKGRQTIASYLKEKDYHTAIIGKWHLGWNWHKDDSKQFGYDFSKPITEGPIDNGFDYFYGISGSLDMPPYVYVENDMPTCVPTRMVPEKNGKEFWRKGPIGEDFSHYDVMENITNRACTYIKKKANNEPFFLYFPLPAPHTPIVPRQQFQGQSGCNEYGDFCLEVDHVVGQIVDAVKEANIEKDTIIVFTADNGCSPMADYPELAKYGHNPSYVFRGHKADIYEGGHRVPLIVQWPSFIPRGTATDQTVCLSDFMATLYDYFGDTMPDDVGEDSISNLPLWRGDDIDGSLREATVMSSIDGSLAIRKGPWKLEMCPGSGGWSFPQTGEEDGLPEIQLYNLDTDISERKNVFASHPGVVASLIALLTKYVRDGRSTPGAVQQNFNGDEWEQLWWIVSEENKWQMKKREGSGLDFLETDKL